MNGAKLAFVVRRMRSGSRQMLGSHLLICAMTAIALFIFGGFLMLQENLQGLLRIWGDQVQLNVYLEKNLDVEQIQPLLARIRNLPEVERVRYISQQQAWRDFEEVLGAQAGVLQGLPQDVLPASLEISLRPQFREPASVDAFAQRLQDEKGVASVEYARDWFERLGLLVRALQWAKWLLGGLLLLATYVLIDGAIKLALVSRRDEVEIMQLVGASKTLVQAPFVLEGMIRGVLGALLAVSCLWGLFRFLQEELAALAAGLGASGGFVFLDGRAVALIVIAGWMVGAVGSLFSARRFLRTWTA